MPTHHHLLIVDKQPESYQELSGLLHDMGFQVFATSTAAQSLQLLIHQFVDVIIIAVNSRDHNGFELCKSIRKLEHYQHTPILFAIENNDDINIIEGLQIGGADYLHKPYQVDKTLARINNYLHLSHLGRIVSKQRKLLTQQKNTIIEKTHIIENLVQALEYAREVTEQANNAKSQFFTNMNYELRAPVDAIIGYSEILKEEAEYEFDQHKVEDLERISNASQHLLSLMNDVLDFSKLSAGQLQVFSETFDIHDLFADVKQASIRLFERNKNQLHIQCPPHIHNIQADLGRLRQVLINLLSNAAKFTEQGHIYLRVHDDNPDLLTIEIEDTGVGMGQKQLNKILSLFKQVETESPAKSYHGGGLGLTISKRLLEMMGGQITVASILGKGSLFSIHLPYQNMEKPQTSAKS